MTLIHDTPATASTFAPGRWSGHWIGPTPDRTLDSPMGVGTGLAPHAFERVMFRRQVEVATVPESAPLRLTADSRYVLFVNGTEVGRGPVRSQPRRLRYDEHDIARFLVAGANSIAVLVTYYGTANAFWQPAAASGNFGADPVLVLEARIGDQELVSDDGWRAARGAGWGAFEGAGIDGVPVEIVDARELPTGWLELGFDDSSWDAAAIRHVDHIGGFAVSQPPTDPYGKLLPRGIAALSSEIIAPASVLDGGVTHLDEPWTSTHPAERAVQLLDQLGGAGGTPTHLPLEVTIARGEAHHLAIDFGRIVAGFVTLEVEAPAGTSFELYYREIPWDPNRNPHVPAPSTSAQYIARGSDDRYQALELNGLRFLHLVTSAPDTDQPIDVAILSVTIDERHYPETGGAFFRSSDPEIDALYRAGIRTVSMNAFDAFTDCPTREQRAWVGDGVVHQLVHLTTNDDWRLARNYVELGASPRSDGILPMTVVGEIEHSQGLTIPDWSLHWVHGVHNLFRYRGDRAEILRYLPVIEGILRWYTPYVDDRGTLTDVPEWNLVDWSSVFSTGRSSLLTSLWGRGLREFAELSRWVGNEANAAWADELWDAANVGFEDFWDEDRGRYIDHILHGERMPASSQAAGATAIVAGFAPEERWNRIIDGITDPATIVVRSWIGGDGGYDMVKIGEQIRGVQRIDWDAEREVVIAEPFYSYLVHDAVAIAGRQELLLDLMRRWSDFLVDGYDTFGECWGWGTPVHGWSSTPTKDLVQHILGVQPAEPGFTVAAIAPRLGALTHVEAQVPTPFGHIAVRIEDGTLAVSSPVPVRVTSLDGTTTELPAGSHEGVRI